MVKQQLCQPGDMTAHLPPLSVGNEIAIEVWNRLGAEIKYPDVFYVMALAGAVDFDMTLERLYVLKDTAKDG